MAEPTNPALLNGVENLYEQVARGNQVAKDRLLQIRAHADAGDVTALATLNTLAAVRFKKLDPAMWWRVEVMWKKIQAGDPDAIAWAAGVQRKTKEGNQVARRILGMLNAHKDKETASAWAKPGASENGNTRTRNMTNMSFARRSVDQHGNIIGADPVAAVKKFFRLTPEAESGLIQLMLRGAASRPITATVATAQNDLGIRAAEQAAAAAAAANAGATPADVEAAILDANDPSKRYSLGQMIANVNPAIAARRDAAPRSNEWLYGFYNGLVISMGRSTEGPGQQRQRDEMFTAMSNQGIYAQDLMAGFRDGQALMYAYTRNRPNASAPFGFRLPTVAKSVGRIRNLEPKDYGLQGICDQAADAVKRNSPAAAQLVAKCAFTRKENIMKGLYLVDKFSPNDPDYRVTLTNAGEAVVTKNPKMAQFRASLPNGVRQRGFTMAMGVRAGKSDPNFVTFVTPGLSGDPELLRGFLDGMNM